MKGLLNTFGRWNSDQSEARSSHVRARSDGYDAAPLDTEDRCQRIVIGAGIQEGPQPVVKIGGNVRHSGIIDKVLLFVGIGS